MSGTASMDRGNSGADGLIKGVCARLAERAGVAVWMPRAAFVIFGLLHWVVALVLYFVMARYLCPNRTGSFAPRTMRSWFFTGRSRPRVVPPVARYDGDDAVRQRFSALDRRLAEMEAASLAQEAGLRRAFRDLERG